MMNTQQDDQISNMDGIKESSFSVGTTLREAREQLGLSVNDVANRIKFAPRQIESLEADDFVRLPEAAFVRGFVRSYARLLELDPNRLLSGLPSSHVQTSSNHEVKSVDIPLPTAFSARRHNIIWLAAALVIALSLAIFERLHDRAPDVAAPVAKTTVQPLELPGAASDSTPAQLPEQAQPPAVVPPQTVRVVPLPAPAAQQPVAPKPVAGSPPVKQAWQPVPQASPRTTAPAPVAATTDTAQQAAQPKSVTTAPAKQTWQPVPQAAVPAAPAPGVTAVPAPAGVGQPVANVDVNATEHALRLEFDEDAWVEIKDETDKALISRMHTAGSLVRVKGKGPLVVVIGNARAVRLFDNGKKINLERYTTAEVARVKLK